MPPHEQRTPSPAACATLAHEDGRPFVSGAYQARSCSLRCQARAIKRAYRERLHARGAEDPAAGLPAEDAAEQSSA